MVLSSLESCQPTEYTHASGYGNYTGSCYEIASAIYIHPHYIYIYGMLLKTINCILTINRHRSNSSSEETVSSTSSNLLITYQIVSKNILEIDRVIIQIPRQAKNQKAC